MVYCPGDVKAILNEGMPSRNNPMQRGNLYVKFTIEFPKSGSLNDAARKVCISSAFINFDKLLHLESE